MASSSLTTMLYPPYHHSQNVTGNGNMIRDSGAHVVDFSMEGEVIAFEGANPVPDDMRSSQLRSLLVQRARVLAGCNPGGSVSLSGNGCDREVLDYLLDVLLPIRHSVRLEINM